MEQKEIIYDAILVRGTPRFRANKRMTAAENVPADVRESLVRELLKKELEPELANEPVTTEATPAPLPGLSREDFEEAAKILGEHGIQPATLHTDADISPGIPSEYEMELIKQLEDAKVTIASLTDNEAKQIDPETLSLVDLAQAMYVRYGVYTVFVNTPPQPDDINPLTAKPMTRYEVGLSYQNFKYASSNGLLEQDFGQGYLNTEASRGASAVHAEEIAKRVEDPEYKAPEYKSFADRTSVRGQNMQSTTTVSRSNDPISEEPTAEPNLHGQTIRPDW